MAENYIQTPLKRSPECSLTQNMQPHLWLGVHGATGGVFGVKMSRGISHTDLDGYLYPLQTARRAVQVPRLWQPGHLLGRSTVQIITSMPPELPRGVPSIVTDTLTTYTRQLGIPEWQLEQSPDDPDIWTTEAPTSKIHLEATNLYTMNTEMHAIPAAHIITAGLRLAVAASVAVAVRSQALPPTQ